MPRIRLLPILPLTVLTACGRAGAAGDTATVRDSAGIAIVENHRGRWEEGGGWRLAEEPSLRIGVAEGEAAYQLDGVRGVLRLVDGRIVVANGGDQQVRWFDARGRHVASAGGEGGGPGEFQGLTTLRRLPGDTVLAYDPTDARLSWFDPAGQFVRATTLRPVGEVPPRFVERFDDGSLLLSVSTRRFPSGPPSGTSRDTLLWLRMRGEDAMDSLPVTPGTESSITVTRAGGAVQSMRVMTLPFMRGVQTAAAGDRYWQALTETYSIVLRRADGTPERIVRRRVEAVPVRGAYLDSVRRVREADHGPQANDVFEGVEIPGQLPVLERLLVDDTGALWVQRTAWPRAGAEWDVFDAEGTMLGTVRMPVGLRAAHIGADFVLGVWRDEDGVEQVRMYRLMK